MSFSTNQLSKVKIFEFDGINVPEYININTSDGLSECKSYHYWYFLSIDFKFQSKVCDDCHDMTQKYMKSDDTTVVTKERK